MASKYDPLKDYLSNRVTLKMTYSEIENILGFTLPPSAYKRKQWWHNETHGHEHNHTQLNAWEGAGWKVKDVELGEYIIFHRAEYARLN
ncbi:hypothetical protein [Paenibacillus sp. HJGM_3]|uniref:DUF7662 domain-containing protein n=1 Tax=Paenibacillus sp. HJGM_3 TaxID=3379816 RepID=UPI00385F77CC